MASRRRGRLAVRSLPRRVYFLFLYTEGGRRSGVRVHRARVENTRHVRLKPSDKKTAMLIGPFLCKEWGHAAYELLLECGAIVEAPSGNKPVKEW